MRHTVVTVGSGETVRVSAAERLMIDGRVDGATVSGPLVLTPGEHRLDAGTIVTLERGDPIPVINSLPSQSNANWLRPLGSGEAHPLYVSLSLIIAICLGTMGLPHVLVRFYTNPDGRDTRRTTLVVIVLLSSFYLLPTLLGAFGRRYVPSLLLTGNTDATVLVLPEQMLRGEPGQILGALVTAGAFAAFLSTASGLTVSVAGVISQELVRRGRAPGNGPGSSRRAVRIRSFRLATVMAVTVPYALSLPSERLGLAAVVGLAFAVAAASFCPLLVLGIWWPKLTAPGALAGLVVGGSLATAAVLVTLIARPGRGWPAALLAEPAAWAVPVTFAVMIVVSLATSATVRSTWAGSWCGCTRPSRWCRSLRRSTVRRADRPFSAPDRAVRRQLGAVERITGAVSCRAADRAGTVGCAPPPGVWASGVPSAKERRVAISEADRPVPSEARPAFGAGFADPGPLGLAGFAGTTFFLSVVNTNMLGASVQTVVLGLALFYGGLAQLLAGMWEFVKGNTFGAVAFTSFGAFWMSFWYLLNHLPTRRSPPTCSTASASTCWCGRSSPRT